MDWESEVRFKPGADVHVLGRYDHTAPYDRDAFSVPDTEFAPVHPEYHKGFKYTPINQSVPVEHVEGGASDYTDVGLPKKTPYATWKSRQFTDRGLT